MAQMNVSVPHPMKDWCEAQVQKGRYSTTSDYVRELIRRDQDRQDGLEELRAAIDKGFASGVSERSHDEILADARSRAEKLTDRNGR